MKNFKIQNFPCFLNFVCKSIFGVTDTPVSLKQRQTTVITGSGSKIDIK